MGDGSREKTDGRHQRRHHDGPDPGIDAQFDRGVQGMALVAHMLQVVFKNGDQQYAVLDTDAEQRDEADTGGNTEIGAGKVQRYHAADDGEGHVEEDQPRILEVAEHHEKQDEDQQQRDGHDFFQAFGGALLVFEITLPFHRIASFQPDDLAHFFLRLGDGTAHVTAADGELQGGIALVVIAEDQAGTGLQLDRGDFLDRYLGAILGRHQQVADIVQRRPVLFRETYADIELLDPFVQGGGGLAA